MTGPSCAACGQPVTWHRAPARERTHGTVGALLEPGLSLRCDTHGIQPPTTARDSAIEAARERLPRARRCRLRRTCCRACGARLLLPPRRTRRSVTVAATGLPVHTIHLDLVLTRCPDCGLEQLPWQTQQDLDALLEVLYDPEEG